ncbi:MAG: ABC transporter substrate-binding protein [Candidatus Thorarchaeota archaeon]
MSSQNGSTNKAFAIILAVIVFIAALAAILIFTSRPDQQGGFFATSIRYYTKGTEKVFFPEYSTTIIQSIKDIGIDAVDYPSEYSYFLDVVVKSRDYEMALIEIEGESVPHLELFFTEGASWNIFNFKAELDNGTTNSYISNITKETDFPTRKSMFEDLQVHLMDNVLPMVPLFSPVRTFGFWDNLKGFTSSLGISNSLPYMYFVGSHEGQSSTDQLNIGIGRWFDLHPLTIKESGEKTIVSLFMDKLIEVDENGVVTKYGLIDNWEYINQTTLLVHLRDGVEWHPDVDGLFPNQLFSPNDVIFTLDLLRSPLVNVNYEVFRWIKSYEMYNSSTVAIYIDSDPSTPEKEPYAFPLEDLSVYPLPDHYLNVGGDIENIISSGRWSKFRTDPFGTGKYIYNSTESQTDLTAVLYRNDNWHNVGVIPGEPTNLAFEKIEAFTRTDTFSMRIDLQNGNLDIADFGKDPAIEDRIDVSDIKVVTKLENSLIILAFNLENEIFGGNNNFIPTNETGISKGLAIRKALASVIDKKLMNTHFHNNKYNLSHTPVSPYFKDYYFDGVQQYPFNMSQALDYLSLAGYNLSRNNEGQTVETSFSLMSSLTSLSFGIILAVVFQRRRKKRV